MPTHPTIILPTATGHSSTTTTTTTSPPNTTAPTDGPLTTGAGSAARSMRSTDFVDLIIIGIQLVYFNTSWFGKTTKKGYFCHKIEDRTSDTWHSACGQCLWTHFANLLFLRTFIYVCIHLLITLFCPSCRNIFIETLLVWFDKITGNPTAASAQNQHAYTNTNVTLPFYISKGTNWP